MQWSRHGVEEATWEREDALKKEFPHLIKNQPNLEDEIHFKWGKFVTSQKNHQNKLLTKNIFQNIFNAELESFPAIHRPDTKNLISIPTPKSIII